MPENPAGPLPTVVNKKAKDAEKGPVGKKTPLGAPHDPATDFKGEKPDVRPRQKKRIVVEER